MVRMYLLRYALFSFIFVFALWFFDIGTQHSAPPTRVNFQKSAQVNKKEINNTVVNQNQDIDIEVEVVVIHAPAPLIWKLPSQCLRSFAALYTKAPDYLTVWQAYNVCRDEVLFPELVAEEYDSVLAAYLQVTRQFEDTASAILNGKQKAPLTCWDNGTYCYEWGVAVNILEYLDDQRMIPARRFIGNQLQALFSSGVYRQMTLDKEMKKVYPGLVIPERYVLCNQLSDPDSLMYDTAWPAWKNAVCPCPPEK